LAGSQPTYTNPLEEPAVWTFDTVTTQEAVDFATQNSDGAEPPIPLVNSSGEPFDPPLTEDFYDQTITISRLQDSFFPVDYAALVPSTNSALAFSGPISLQVGRGLMRRISGTGEVHPNSMGDPTQYWRVAYTIWVRRQGMMSLPERAWWRRVANLGFYENRPHPLAPTVLRPVRITELGDINPDGRRDRKPISQPVPLTTGEPPYVGPKGLRIPQIKNQPISVQWLEFMRYPSLDWSGLNL
jgi:hypothetical protein